MCLYVCVCLIIFLERFSSQNCYQICHRNQTGPVFFSLHIEKCVDDNVQDHSLHLSTKGIGGVVVERQRKTSMWEPNKKSVAHCQNAIPSQGVQIMSKSLTNCQIKMVFVLQNTRTERGREKALHHTHYMHDNNNQKQSTYNIRTHSHTFAHKLTKQNEREHRNNQIYCIVNTAA